jgi:hypothetical protein
MHITSPTVQTKLAEKSSDWGLKSYWAVQYYLDPRARHYDSPTSLTWTIVERWYQLSKATTMADEMVLIREESMV